MKTLPALRCALALLLGSLGLRAAAPPTLDAVREAMRGDKPEAGALAEALVAAGGEAAAEARYLGAVACFHARDYAGTVRAADALVQADPKSVWRHKAVFLQAQALVELRKFGEAARLYQAEAARLLASERKQGLAGVIVDYADKLAAPADPRVPGSPAPDFAKAHELYGKALGMEIDRETRDDVLFKRARAIQQAKDFQQAQQEYQAYLSEFDPEGASISGTGAAAIPRLRPPPAGRHVIDARFHLAESRIDAGDLEPGRMVLEDLLRLAARPAAERPAHLAGLDARLADIRWRLLESHFTLVLETENANAQQAVANAAMPVIGNNGGLSNSDAITLVPRESEPETAVKACRDYLAAFPGGSRAVRAAWRIAEAWHHAGRAEEAIAAYRAFLAGEGYRLPAGEAAQRHEEEIGATPAAQHAGLAMRALFRTGRLLADQGRHDEAITVWQSYVKNHPNGPQWADSQAAIIESEYRKGMDALAAGEEALALRLLDAFLEAHPIDPRAPAILFLHGAVHELAARNLEKVKGDPAAIQVACRKAMEEWGRLVSKYPQSPEALNAQMRSATMHEETFGEYEQALQIYRRLVAQFQHSEAQAGIARLTEKHLALSAERTFRTTEKATVRLTLRNLPSCTFRLHRIDLQAYFRKMHAIGGVEGLDVSLIQPDQTWTFKPENYQPHRTFTQDVEIPFPDGQPGAVVVMAGDDDWESSVLVVRSDVEMIVKSSRREVLAFVQDMLTGKPAADVDLLVSDGKAVIATGRTGVDGVFHAPVASLKDQSDVRVLALGRGHAAFHLVDLQGLAVSSGLTPKGFVYTDRPLYQPGETVSLRGILREVRDGQYAVPENAEFLVSVANPQGLLLSEQKVSLSRFGTFDSTLDLPATSAPGDYTVTARQERKVGEPLVFQGTFAVRSFTLAKIRLSLDFPRRVWLRGETVTATARAEYHWGEPLADRALRCELPDGRVQALQTDGEGRVSLSFDTGSMRPGRALAFRVVLEGEEVAAQESVTLARLGFSIRAEPSQPVVLAGEPFDLRLTSTGADGNPSSEKLRVEVFRAEAPRSHPLIDPLVCPSLRVAAEVRVSEQEVITDAAGRNTVKLVLEKGGTHHVRVTGTDRFGQPVTARVDVQVSDATDATRLRLFADSATLRVGVPATVRLHSRMDKGLALLTFEGETVLRHRILELKAGFNELPLDVGHDLFPNFRLAAAALDGRELRTAAKDFTVERELKVTVTPRQAVFAPGQPGEVEITVTDQAGKPVEAELSLALVNEALHALARDPAAPILEFFQKDARRFAGFQVGATSAYRYEGQTRAVSRAVAEEGDRLSRVQQELAARVDPDGHDLGKNERFGFTYAGQTMVTGGTLFLGGQVDATDSISDLRAANRPTPTGNREERNGRGEYSLSEASDRPHPGAKGGPSNGGLRREVQGEGRWLPTVVTGADGRAVVKLDMPETTTAWRLTARGCSVETLVGEATAATLTRRDFFVELKQPSFLREGDEIRPLARVHNLTDFAGKVELVLTLRDAGAPGAVLAEQRRPVDVKARGGAEVVFDAFKVPAATRLRVELTAAAGPHRDALHLDTPVEPWGLPVHAHAGGTAVAETAAVLALPENRKYSSLRMRVRVGPDFNAALPEMALRSGGESLAFHPTVLGGHPAHELLAVASALAHVRRAGAAEGDTEMRLAARARALVAAVVSGQADDGNWSGGMPGENMTARAFWSLVTAREAGLAVHAASLEKAAAALTQSLEKAEAGDFEYRAVALHALASDKRADFAACNRLYRERNSLSVASLAHLTLAFQRMERGEIAAELATLLESKADAASPDGQRWRTGSKSPWLNDGPETSALVLLALSAAKPNSALAAPTAQSLLADTGCAGLPTARARGVAMAALAAWHGPGRDAAVDMEIGVSVNGREIGRVKGTGGVSLVDMEVPADALKTDKNLVEFRMTGRGRYTHAVTLTGFSADTAATPENVRPRITAWTHTHATLEYRGRPIPAGSTSPVTQLEHGQRVMVNVQDQEGTWMGNQWFTLDIPLPAGARLVEGSLSVSNNFRAEVLPSSIRVIYFQRCPHVQFQLTGNNPGGFRMLPAVIREIGNGAFLSVGPSPVITVLAPGEKSPDPYRMNNGERYALGKLLFDDGDHAAARVHLAAVRASEPRYNEAELARMLLWIHTTPEFYDAKMIVDLFELLREKFPNLEIPYDRILVVGRAYLDIREFERAWLVFRATISASFTNDAAISAVLEDAGRFVSSIDFQERLWREYPETAEVVSAYFSLSQLLFEKAPQAHTLPPEDGVQPEKVPLLRRTAGLLRSFLALHPRDPLADDAAFSLASCMLALRDHAAVVALGTEFAKTYADSPKRAGFQYMAALGHFWQNHYAEALAAAKVVADGDSKDRDFARYILGQIFHAEGKPGEAIAWYTRVRELYPDAAEAIAYFERKSIGLDEVTEFKPGQPVTLTLRHRNVKEAFLQVYRVDLMKLTLQQKNLGAITRVQLAGIKPEWEQAIALGDGRDYVEKERAVTLPLKDEAAYLVICRGDDLFASGMVLVTPLRMEVQEDPASGRVRVNVLDTAKGGYRPDVHVKAIGSADAGFRGGETDLRGIFIADGLRGRATVIARDGNSRYAFFRGQTWLGAPEQQEKGAAGQLQVLPAVQYDLNLNADNGLIQKQQNDTWNAQRRQGLNRGVQLKAAY